MKFNLFSKIFKSITITLGISVFIVMYLLYKNCDKNNSSFSSQKNIRNHYKEYLYKPALNLSKHILNIETKFANNDSYDREIHFYNNLFNIATYIQKFLDEDKKFYFFQTSELDTYENYQHLINKIQENYSRPLDAIQVKQKVASLFSLFYSKYYSFDSCANLLNSHILNFSQLQHDEIKNAMLFDIGHLAFKCGEINFAYVESIANSISPELEQIRAQIYLVLSRLKEKIYGE